MTVINQPGSPWTYQDGYSGKPRQLGQTPPINRPAKGGTPQPMKGGTGAPTMPMVRNMAENRGFDNRQDFQRAIGDMRAPPRKGGQMGGFGQRPPQAKGGYAGPGGRPQAPQQPNMPSKGGFRRF